MPRPMNTVTGKVTDLRTELDYLREHPEIKSEDPEVSAYQAAIARVKGIYASERSIKKTAKVLKIGKRTLERAMVAHEALSVAISEVRACGR